MPEAKEKSDLFVSRILGEKPLPTKLSVPVLCNNCGRRNSIELTKGQRLYTILCPSCDTNGLFVDHSKNWY